MTPTEARNLLKGTVVTHDTDPSVRGTVLNVLLNGVGVNWENVMVEVLRYCDAKHLDIWQPERRHVPLET